MRTSREAIRSSIPPIVPAATRFEVGQLATMKGLRKVEGGDFINPHKGTLKMGKHYPVLDIINTHLKVPSDNGDAAYYHHKYFEPHDGPGFPMQDLSKDYEEALAAQEAMEKADGV